MKIKKFNAILVTAFLSGALLIPSAIGLMGRTLWRPLTSLDEAVEVIAGERTISDAFASEGKQVTTIQWRSRRGEMPGEATLKKWVAGDRTYYEISGPINRHFTSRGAVLNSEWGSYFACEVFFAREGDTYDQWLINPAHSAIYHFVSPGKFAGQGSLASSRYQVRINGDRVFISFWCYNSDTPRNIVFNYNHSIGNKPDNLSWVTTRIHQNSYLWIHHDPASWTDP